MSAASRYRKTIAAAIGTAATLAVLIPEDALPDQWRPWVGILVGLATVLGVRQVRNDPPIRSRQEAAERVFRQPRHRKPPD